MKKENNLSCKLQFLPLNSKTDSERVIRELFNKHYAEVLNLNPCEVKRTPRIMLKAIAEKYYTIHLNHCIQLRNSFINETSRAEKIRKLLNYTYEMCNILKIGALDDEWVRLGIRLIKKHIMNDKLQIVLRKMASELLKNIFIKFVPSLKGKKDIPPADIIFLDYQSQLKILESGIKRNYRNPVSKKLDLKKLYCEKEYPFINDKLLDKLKDFTKQKIAFYILAYKYNREPSVMRDWIYKAEKEHKRLNRLWYKATISIPVASVF